MIVNTENALRGEHESNGEQKTILFAFEGQQQLATADAFQESVDTHHLIFDFLDQAQR